MMHNFPGTLFSLSVLIEFLWLQQYFNLYEDRCRAEFRFQKTDFNKYCKSLLSCMFEALNPHQNMLKVSKHKQQPRKLKFNPSNPQATLKQVSIPSFQENLKPKNEIYSQWYPIWHSE